MDGTTRVEKVERVVEKLVPGPSQPRIKLFLAFKTNLITTYHDISVGTTEQSSYIRKQTVCISLDEPKSFAKWYCEVMSVLGLCYNVTTFYLLDKMVHETFMKDEDERVSKSEWRWIVRINIKMDQEERLDGSMAQSEEETRVMIEKMVDDLLEHLINHSTPVVIRKSCIRLHSQRSCKAHVLVVDSLFIQLVVRTMGGTDNVEKVEEKKEKHKEKEHGDHEKEEHKGEETKSKDNKKKKKDKDDNKDRDTKEEKKKSKNPEDKKDPSKLKLKLEKIEGKMRDLEAKREEILKLLQEAETNTHDADSAEAHE
ncbi:hypothetical protein Droror1_Dr00021170 [Drosera rotundifolia]